MDQPEADSMPGSWITSTVRVDEQVEEQDREVRTRTKEIPKR